jgi:hypothetical protein
MNTERFRIFVEALEELKGKTLRIPDTRSLYDPEEIAFEYLFHLISTLVMQPYYLTKDISELQEMCEFNETSGYLLPLAVERFLGCDFKELANPSLDICDNQQSHNRLFPWFRMIKKNGMFDWNKAFGKKENEGLTYNMIIIHLRNAYDNWAYDKWVIKNQTLFIRFTLKKRRRTRWKQKMLRRYMWDGFKTKLSVSEGRKIMKMNTENFKILVEALEALPENIKNNEVDWSRLTPTTEDPRDFTGLISIVAEDINELKKLYRFQVYHSAGWEDTLTTYLGVSIEVWAFRNQKVWGNDRGLSVNSYNEAWGKRDNETLICNDIIIHLRSAYDRWIKCLETKGENDE